MEDGRDGGREGWRTGGMVDGRDGGREGWKTGGRTGGRAGGREDRREGGRTDGRAGVMEVRMVGGKNGGRYGKMLKGMFCAVSSPSDRSKRFTLFLPWQTSAFRHQLGFSGKHCRPAAITRERLLTHISTTLYSQVVIYTADWT